MPVAKMKLYLPSMKRLVRLPRSNWTPAPTKASKLVTEVPSDWNSKSTQGPAKTKGWMSFMPVAVYLITGTARTSTTFELVAE